MTKFCILDKISLNSDSYFKKQEWRQRLKVGDKIDALIVFNKLDSLPNIPYTWEAGTINKIDDSKITVEFNIHFYNKISLQLWSSVD